MEGTAQSSLTQLPQSESSADFTTLQLTRLALKKIKTSETDSDCS